ncbi:hypothetical protein CEXT_435121 [Caerostris extrusa]|uniref:Uncharacterized protein n=1 Tax=Caerostris extrusa TaxID=172846 RepID=A0AAV4RNV0_CAEEX|nr:hypothetical protein CEXT_435121 [Caerostris extrusa]
MPIPARANRASSLSCPAFTAPRHSCPSLYCPVIIIPIHAQPLLRGIHAPYSPVPMPQLKNRARAIHDQPLLARVIMLSQSRLHCPVPSCPAFTAPCHSCPAIHDPSLHETE